MIRLLACSRHLGLLRGLLGAITCVAARYETDTALTWFSACRLTQSPVVFRLLCLFFFGWSFVGFTSACGGFSRSEAVWHENGMFGSHGLSAFRMVNHALLMANQAVGLYAHAKRDAKKADVYFWGWILYTGLCLALEISRMGHIEGDAKTFSSQSCVQCKLKNPSWNATAPTAPGGDCDSPALVCPQCVPTCAQYHSIYYRSCALHVSSSSYEMHHSIYYRVVCHHLLVLLMCC